MSPPLRRTLGLLACAAALGSTLAHAAEGRAEFTVPTPRVRVLENGLTVAIFPSARLPVAQVQLLVPAGTADEPIGQAGVASLTAQMLREGTASRTAEEFDGAVQSLGGTMGQLASHEFTTLGGSFLAADFERGLELIADAVLHPIFGEGRLIRAKNQTANALASASRDPGTLADEHLWSMVFRDHPLGRSPLDALHTMDALRVEHVRAFHRDRYRPDRAILAIAGDVSPERAFQAAEEQFGAWRGRVSESTALAFPAPEAGWRVRIVDTPGSSLAEVRVGTLGPGRAAADFPALSVAAECLRAHLRPASGPAPAFDLEPSVVALRQAGMFSVSASVPADSVGSAVSRLRDELTHWTAAPPPEGAIAAARSSVGNAFPLQLETLSALLSRWMLSAWAGEPADALPRFLEHVAGVGAPAAYEAGSRWVRPDRMVLVVVGPADRLRGPLEAFGPVEVVGPGDRVAEGLPSAVTASPSPAQLARGREMAARVIAAHGGLARLRGVKDSSLEGEMVVYAEPRHLTGPFRQVRKEPSRFLFSMTLGEAKSTQVLDGDQGWAITGNDLNTLIDQDPEGMAALRAGFRSDVVHLLLMAADTTARVAWRGQESVDGRRADVLEIVGTDGERRVLLADSASGLVRAMEQSDAGHSVRRVYDDYRDVSGLQIPFHEERRLDGQIAAAVTLRQASINSGVGDEVFRRPGSNVPGRRGSPVRPGSR